jgi:hypothetical protein|tara:strand:+ start:458 stop:868 length:411 start_codon:yes stop_codon:yes gene_type:complete
MKKIVFTFSLFMIAVTVQSQETKKNRNLKIIFEVDGVCGMCKKRIETASLKTKGVKFALWDLRSHQLNLIIDERKTAISTVQKNILEVGHDLVSFNNKKLVATDEAYNSVDPCCKYRDESVVLDHKGELKKQQKKE